MQLPRPLTDFARCAGSACDHPPSRHGRFGWIDPDESRWHLDKPRVGTSPDGSGSGFRRHLGGLRGPDGDSADATDESLTTTPTAGTEPPVTTTVDLVTTTAPTPGPTTTYCSVRSPMRSPPAAPGRRPHRPLRPPPAP